MDIALIIKMHISSYSFDRRFLNQIYIYNQWRIYVLYIYIIDKVCYNVQLNNFKEYLLCNIYNNEDTEEATIAKEEEESAEK